jgi:hypothetical protein
MIKTIITETGEGINPRNWVSKTHGFSQTSRHLSLFINSLDKSNKNSRTTYIEDFVQHRKSTGKYNRKSPLDRQKSLLEPLPAMTHGGLGLCLIEWVQFLLGSRSSGSTGRPASDRVLLGLLPVSLSAPVSLSLSHDQRLFFLSMSL